MEDRKQIEKILTMFKAYDEKTLQQDQAELKEELKTEERKELIKEAIKIICECIDILKDDSEEVGQNGR